MRSPLLRCKLQRVAPLCLLSLCLNNTRAFQTWAGTMGGIRGMDQVQVSCLIRPRVSAARMAADEGWMFIDAKGLNKKSAGTLELGVISRPFGVRLIVGDEHWLDVSKPSEELLVETAHKQGFRVAYTVGRASSSGSFANAQGFLAGTTASLLSIRNVRRKPGTFTSCPPRSCAPSLAVGSL